MKLLKPILALSLLLMTFVAQAQSIVGKWATSEFERDGAKLTLITDFAADNALTLSLKSVEYDTDLQLTITMGLVMPGTYSVAGNDITCTFDDPHAVLADLNLEKDGYAFPAAQLEQMKAVMWSDNSRADILRVFNQFKHFTIVSLTDNTLVLNDGKADLTFNRVK